jgi:hypothetical protein
MLGGTSPTVSRRSIRRLRDLRYLTVHTPWGVSGMNRIALADAAFGLLERLDVETTGLTKITSLDRRRPHLAHHELGVDVALHLHEACARMAGRGWRLEQYLTESRIRADVGVAQNAQVQLPDGCAVLEHHTGTRVALAIEIDRATERPTYVVAKKGESYSDLFRAGQPLMGVTDWRVAFVCETKRRRLTLLRYFAEAGLREPFFFEVSEELAARNILVPSAPWWTLDDATDDGIRVTRRGLLAALQDGGQR